MFRKYTIILYCFLMCPRRSYPKNTENRPKFDEDKEFNPEKEVSPYYPEQDKAQTSQWVTDVIKGYKYTNQLSGFDDTEPGFDLTDEEKKKFKLWPKGIIKYYIDNVSFDAAFRDMIRLFLSKASSLTGLRFIELQKAPSPRTRYVFFINRRGVLECQDYTTVNFTNEGVQVCFKQCFFHGLDSQRHVGLYIFVAKTPVLNGVECAGRVVIGYDCFSDELGPGSLILALAGVPPMHRAPNRDNYIKFNPNNTITDMIPLFGVFPKDEWLFHNIEYDWHSAGHYFWHKYTSNGFAPIAPKKEAPMNVGEFKELSYIDLWKIKKLYQLDTKKSPLAEEAQCNKLFKPGNKFDGYSPQGANEMTPRAKTNKYLGVTNALQEKLDVIEGKNDEKGENKELYDEENTEIEMPKTKTVKKPDVTRKQKLNSKRTTSDLSILTASDYGSYEKRMERNNN